MEPRQRLKMTRAGKCRLSTCYVLAMYLWIVQVLTTFTSGIADQQVCLLPGDTNTCSSPPPPTPRCPPFVNTVMECPDSITAECCCHDRHTISYTYSVKYKPSGCNVSYAVPPHESVAIGFSPQSCSHFNPSKDPTCSHPGYSCPVGTTDVTCQAYDSCRVTECSFQVTVIDSLPPTIECSYVVDNASCVNISCNVTDKCDYPNTISVNCQGLDGTMFTYPGPTRVENVCTNITCTATDLAGNNASDSFPIGTVGCPSSVVKGVFGTLTFPATLVNQYADSKERCFEYVQSESKPQPRGRRRCVCELSAAIWKNHTLANCTGIGDINELLLKIAQAYVTAENVTEYSYDVRRATDNASGIDEHGLRAIAIALQKIVSVIVSSEEVTKNAVLIVDNVLNVMNGEFVEATDYKAPTIILDSLEEQIKLFQIQGERTNLTVIGKNVAIVALQVPESSLKAGIGFGTVTSSGPEQNESVLKDLIQTMVFYNTEDIPSTMFDASILLPSYLLEFLPPNAEENGSAPVTFLIFQNSKLFQAYEPRYMDVNSRQQLVGTRVISATVEGVVIEGLPQGREVETTFLELNVTLGNETLDNRTCVFWEKTGQGGRWSPEGCRREDLPNINRIRCLCNHLTSFAVLLDYRGDGGQKILDILSFIGCIISIICLVITLVTYLSMKKQREKQPQQILINLCFNLLGLYLVFVVGIDRRFPTAGCVVIGFLIHFFLMSSISWMTVEAVNMFFLFVKVFNADVMHFLLKASLCAYGLPLLVCIITVAWDSSIYLGDNTYCFVKPGPALYYGVMLIVAVILVINFIIFGMVMRRLSCRKSVQRTNQADHREIWRRVQNAVAITILLGLTWLFGFLAISGARLLFNILFLVFNSLQGFFIFLMFCVRQKEVLEQWKQWVHCHFGYSRPEQRQKEKYINTKSKTTGTSHGELSPMEMLSNRESMQIRSETLSPSELSVQT